MLRTNRINSIPLVDFRIESNANRLESMIRFVDTNRAADLIRKFRIEFGKIRIESNSKKFNSIVSELCLHGAE